MKSKNIQLNKINKYIKEKYNVYKLFIDNGGVVWYTIYRVKGEEQKKTLTNKIFKVATWQLERILSWKTLLNQKAQIS